MAASLVTAVGLILVGISLLFLEPGRNHAGKGARRLADLAEWSDDAIIGNDLNRIITAWNHGAEKLFGYTAREILGQPFSRLLSGESLKQEELLLSKVASGESVMDFETMGRTKDGRLVDVSLTVSPIKDPSGQVIGMSRIAHDMQRHRQAHQDSLRLAAIVEWSNDAIIGKDLNSIITSWNRGAERIFGYSAAEMIGSSILRLIPADRQEEEKHIIDKIKQGKTVNHFETLRLTKDGRLIQIAVTASPIRDAAGKIIGVSKIARDITERKNAEKSLHESMSFAQATIDALPAQICVLDESGLILATNSAWRQFAESNALSGTGTQVGANYLKICDQAEGEAEGSARAFAAGIRSVFSGEKNVFELEYSCHAPNEERWFLGRATCFSREGLFRMLVAHENITARKRTDQENNKLRQLVEHSPDFIGLSELHGKITFLNAGGRKMIGLDEDQDLGSLNIKDYVPPQWHKFFRESILATVMKEGIWQGEMQLVNLKTGALVDVSRTTFMINDPSTGNQFFASVTRDITERKRVENELRSKTALLEAQVNCSPDAILVVNEQKTRVLQNQRLIELFHVPSEIADNPHDDRLLLHVLGLVKNPEPFRERVQWLYEHPDEIGVDEIELIEGKILDRYSSPVRDKAGKYYGRIWVFRDITERKKAEAARQSQLNELGRWHEAILDREDRILALKREVNELLARLQMPSRYHSPGKA